MEEFLPKETSNVGSSKQASKKRPESNGEISISGVCCLRALRGQQRFFKQPDSWMHNAVVQGQGLDQPGGQVGRGRGRLSERNILISADGLLWPHVWFSLFPTCVAILCT